MNVAYITRDILEGYLNCKYLAHLRLTGQEEAKSAYEDLLLQARLEQQLAAANTLHHRYCHDIIATGVNLARTTLGEGASYILDAELNDDVFRVRFDGLKKVNGRSDLGTFHYVPMLLSGPRRVHKKDRVLLETLGVLLGRIQGHTPNRGVMYHGTSCTATSVPFSEGLRFGNDTLHELARMQRGAAQPKLLLNDHCHICEFNHRCRAQAVKDDNPTLLRGIGEKELKRYARRGLFTLTQIAHTFRPRRKGKRNRPSRVRHHALHALAIRDKTIYVFGEPEVPSSTTEIYLDIEGKPDEQFVYLIGIVICEGNREERLSFWADTKDEERLIFDRLLAVLSQHKNALVYCYGSYEKLFLMRMRLGARRKKAVGATLEALVNVLSIVYAHFYFPTYSNGLKEIGALLGCSWSDETASGTQSIVWRSRWERTGDEHWKEKLLQYNLEDCVALRKLVCFLRIVCKGDSFSPEGAPLDEATGLRVTSVKELEKASYSLPWKTFVNPDLAFVNKRAYFNYQRQRVFLRGSKALRRRHRARDKNRNRTVRASQHVQFTASKCPECSSSDLMSVVKRTHGMGVSTKVKRAFDLRISETGIKRRVIECRATMYQCLQCGHHFTPHRYHRLARHFHGFMSWVIYLQVAHRMSIGTIGETLHDLFGLTVSGSDIIMIRSLMARYYRPTYKRLLQRLVSGVVLHADETEMTLRTSTGYVWVFTSAEEVLYTYRETREGQFLQEMLKDFRGVLISDFYTPYDTLPCPQQKCLIHLIRDMNQDVLSNPFDTELHSITDRFGALLRTIVTTVDEYGLKRSRLRRHSASVAEFFQIVLGQSFSSEPARALQSRLAKNRDKLFTFIDYDGVPWNNNNAEFAIRRLSYFRDENARFMKEAGITDHLVLLSVYQTCRYKGISFLKFLLSRDADIDTFVARKRARHRHRGIELYPRGFHPPHLAPVRRLNALRQMQDSRSQDSADSKE
jgi:predicted RecB family nuclease